MRASSPPLSAGVAGAARPLASRKTRVLVCAGFCAIVALLALRTARECNVPGRPDLARFGMQDFRDAIYFPAAAFLDGADPYDAAHYTRDYPVFSALGPYAPAVLLLYAPFTALTLPRAEVVFLVANVVLVPLLAALILMLCDVRVTFERSVGLAALLLLSRQGQSTVFLGQSTIYVLIGAFTALHYASTRPWLAGLGFAVVALKPTFGIPLAVIMLCRRERIPVVIGAAVCGMLSLVAIGFLIHAAGGVAPVRDALASSPSAFLAVPHNTTTSLRLDTPALLERLTTITPLGTVSVLASITVLLLGALAVRRAAHRDLALALTCLTTLACAYHQTYDSLMLALPATALAVGTWRPAVPHLGRATRPLLFALLVLPALNYLSTFSAMDRLGVHGGWRTAVASINGAVVVAAFLLCVALAFAARPRRA